MIDPVAAKDTKATRRPRGSGLRRERRVYLGELAEEAAGTHCPGDVVEPRKIAAAKGITYSFGEYGDAFDGMLEYRCGRFHVYCNLVRVGDPDCPRARFTLAHELGHYFIDEHRNALASQRVGPHPSLCDFESSLLAEQEADFFAAHLLMPERRFRRATAGVSRDMEGVLELAARYGTSVTSAAVRFVSVNAFPCAVVKWHRKKHDWKFFSSSMLRTKYRRVFTVPSKLPEGSPTRLALAQETPPDGDFFRAGTLASVWFPYVRRGAPLDVVLTEDAIPLGSHGALTMLYPSLDCSVFGTAARGRKRTL